MFFNAALSYAIKRADFYLYALCLCVYLSGGVHATAQHAPAAVQKSFDASFPGARSVSWLRWDQKSHEAHFNFKNEDWVANFDETGKVLEKGFAVDTSEIPATASHDLLTMIEDDALLKNIYKLPRAANDTIYYVDRWTEKEKSGEHNYVRFVFDKMGKLKEERVPLPDEADNDLSDAEHQQPQDKKEEEDKDHDDRVDHHTQEAEAHLQQQGDDDKDPTKDDDDDDDTADLDPQDDDDAPATAGAAPKKPN